jgi:preprotein translocase subunit Sss1
MKKYVLVGASSRCQEMFSKPLKEEFSDVAVIVGIFDINRTFLL